MGLNQRNGAVFPMNNCLRWNLFSPTMAASSELSRILNNVNGTVYPTEPTNQLPMLNTVTFPASVVNKTPQLTDLSFGNSTGKGN